MTSRTQRPSQERQARSRAAQILANEPLLRGSLVLRYRSCGKPYCRCQRGQKHPALYLYTRSEGKQIATYIPKALHDTVRQAVQAGRRVKRLLEEISQHNLQTLVQQKQSLAQCRGSSEAEAPSP
jgi:Family of unknown function (DUF6788)